MKVPKFFVLLDLDKRAFGTSPYSTGEFRFIRKAYTHGPVTLLIQRSEQQQIVGI
ncbi:uncharacterized protein PHALS_01978 [Plasmopara halstedii]|uniref:Uncharacterized protein n=1 Tax=Plasmopara halstedii TaxID=4781 RepID=A0A0P1AWE3_PLAHL|nr:uncharacterized protein PHALS_01978 [Plasmopara halstedii]CEG45697.1 hypothetical protein PHALS_01978 [Plasmopara halstedii]|eukprot:XP_024582066.1 hypothetical protein PHALS_01978 [Plasmopara halstedii]